MYNISSLNISVPWPLCNFLTISAISVCRHMSMTSLWRFAKLLVRFTLTFLHFLTISAISVCRHMSITSLWRFAKLFVRQTLTLCVLIHLIHLSRSSSMLYITVYDKASGTELSHSEHGYKVKLYWNFDFQLTNISMKSIDRIICRKQAFDLKSEPCHKNIITTFLFQCNKKQWCP